MVVYVASPDVSLADGRDEYFRENGFGADGGYPARWVDLKIGPIATPFPNTDGRRRAVRFHDLHHVLTGYATDWRGEFEISAWEVASGCADHWAAWKINLAGIAGGLLTAPRRTFRAFVRGRRSRNLYRATYDERLLSRHVGEVRRELGLVGAPAGATAADVAWFSLALAAGLAIGSVFLILMVPLAIVFNIAALFRRRTAST